MLRSNSRRRSLDCAGQIVAVSQYSALYSLIGDRFGDDGRNTFGIPDLQGRSPRRADSSKNGQIGRKMGFEESQLQLDTSDLPTHTHTAYFQAEQLNGQLQTMSQSPGSFFGTLRAHTVAGGSISPKQRYPGGTL